MTQKPKLRALIQLDGLLYRLPVGYRGFFELT